VAVERIGGGGGVGGGSVGGVGRGGGQRKRVAVEKIGVAVPCQPNGFDCGL